VAIMDEILRLANVNDIPQITRIYNEGIEDRIATLETCLRTEEDMIEWFNNRDEKHSVVVIEDDQGIAVGWASINVFNSRCCYSGVADISIYIQRDKRGKGFGKKLMEYLINTARDQGFHKLVLSTFKFNERGKDYTSQQDLERLAHI
jgi:L-amino acid N-acyltransferase YncA